MVCTVASAEVAGLIAEEADSDYRRVQALKDWILDKAGSWPAACRPRAN